MATGAPKELPLTIKKTGNIFTNKYDNNIYEPKTVHSMWTRYSIDATISDVYLKNTSSSCVYIRLWLKLHNEFIYIGLVLWRRRDTNKITFLKKVSLYCAGITISYWKLVKWTIHRSGCCTFGWVYALFMCSKYIHAHDDGQKQWFTRSVGPCRNSSNYFCVQSNDYFVFASL